MPKESEKRAQTPERTRKRAKTDVIGRRERQTKTKLMKLNHSRQTTHKKKTSMKNNLDTWAAATIATLLTSMLLCLFVWAFASPLAALCCCYCTVFGFLTRTRIFRRWFLGVTHEKPFETTFVDRNPRGFLEHSNRSDRTNNLQPAQLFNRN